MNVYKSRNKEVIKKIYQTNVLMKTQKLEKECADDCVHREIDK